MDALKRLSDYELEGFFDLLEAYLEAINKDHTKPDKIEIGTYKFDFETYLDDDVKSSLAQEGITGNEDINWSFSGLLRMASGFISQNIGVALLVSKRFKGGTVFEDQVANLKDHDFKFLTSVWGMNITGLVDRFIVTENANGIMAYPRDMSPANYQGGVVFRNGLGCTVVFDDQDIQSLQQQPSMINHDPNYDVCQLGDLSVGNGQLSNLNINGTALKNAVESVFELDNNGKNKGTKAALVVHKGKIIYEVYNNSSFAQSTGLTHLRDDVDPTTPLIGWSMTKSVVNAILGAMVHKGKFGDFQQFSDDRKLADPNIADAQIVEDFLKTIKVRDYLNYPSLLNANPDEDITMNDLLRMASGLKWREENFRYDVMEMVFGEPDMAAFAANKGIARPPSRRHNYSSGDTNLIAAVMKACFVKSAGPNDPDPLETYWNFPHENLFNPIGMCNTILQVDHSGTFVGSSYCIASARDWARFGLLFLNDGTVKKTGQRILPAGWVAYSKSLGLKPNGDKLAEHYGAHFWVNKPITADLLDGKKKTGIEGVDKEMFYARGLFGQRVYVVPEHDLVVVRIGTRDKIGLKKFLRDVVDVFSAGPA